MLVGGSSRSRGRRRRRRRTSSSSFSSISSSSSQRYYLEHFHQHVDSLLVRILNAVDQLFDSQVTHRLVAPPLPQQRHHLTSTAKR